MPSGSRSPAAFDAIRDLLKFDEGL
jgi:hypothetical protein